MTTTPTSGAADLPEALHRVIDDFERRERPHPWEVAQLFSECDNTEKHIRRKRYYMPRRNHPKTPLLAVLRQLETDDKRDEFAGLAGTSRLYLYQLSICSRRSCRADLAKRIADASAVMSKKYGTPVLSLETLCSMCAECSTS